MGDPLIHAESSAKIFGGKAKDYLDIHEFLDSSGLAFPDLRHRALTHTTWFIKTMLPVKFGHRRKNSAGKHYSVVEVGTRHVMEDYGGKYVPDASDFLSLIQFEDWMENGKGDVGPPSNRKRREWVDAKKDKKTDVRPPAPRRLPELPLLFRPGHGSRPGPSSFVKRPGDCGGQGMLD